MLSSALRARGFDVEAVADGSQALKRITAAPAGFDLLITDSRMPKLDGVGLVEQARSAGYEGRVLVFASALGYDDRQRYASLGVDRLIEKPGGTSDLMRTIEQVRRTSGAGSK